MDAWVEGGGVWRPCGLGAGGGQEAMLPHGTRVGFVLRGKRLMPGVDDTIPICGSSA